jgi:hypothetical protein
MESSIVFYLYVCPNRMKLTVVLKPEAFASSGGEDLDLGMALKGLTIELKEGVLHTLITGDLRLGDGSVWELSFLPNEGAAVFAVTAGCCGGADKELRAIELKEGVLHTLTTGDLGDGSVWELSFLPNEGAAAFAVREGCCGGADKELRAIETVLTFCDVAELLRNPRCEESGVDCNAKVGIETLGNCWPGWGKDWVLSYEPETYSISKQTKEIPKKYAIEF